MGLGWVLDVVFFGWVGVMVVVSGREMLVRLRTEPDSAEAVTLLLDDVHAHWLLHSGLDRRTARAMRTELGEHLNDTLDRGGTTADVVGTDLGAFAMEWADSHDAPGPWNGWWWRVIGSACFLLTVALISRTLDLLDDGMSELGFGAALLFSLVLAGPLGVAVPWVGRASAGGPTSHELVRVGLVATFVTAIVLAVGAVLVLLLRAVGYGFEPSPGRWWVSALLALAALAAGFGADGRIER